MQVKCYGPGLEPTGCIVNKPADFTIDAQGAGRGQLKIYAQVSVFSNTFHYTDYTEVHKHAVLDPVYMCVLDLWSPFKWYS